MANVVERWNVVTSFIALAPKNQHHYIYSETSGFQTFFMTIKNSPKIYNSFNWYTIENALNDLVNTVTEIPTMSQSDESKIDFIINLLYQKKFNFPSTPAVPMVMLFAPSKSIKNFNLEFKQPKYSEWFKKTMNQTSTPEGVKNFVFQILLGLFNHEKNKEAKYFHIFAADKSAREGLSLNLMKNVYFLKVPKKISTFKQVVGRATRYCNFALEENIKEWRVRPYLLFYDSEDQENFVTLTGKGDIATETVEFLKTISIDCYLFGPYIHESNEEYTCGTKHTMVKGVEQISQISSKPVEKSEQAKKKEQNPPICINYNLGIMYSLTKGRTCATAPESSKSAILTPHDYNEIDAFVEIYISSKLAKLKKLPLVTKEESDQPHVDKNVLRDYFRQAPTIYFSYYDSISSSVLSSTKTDTQRKEIAKFFESMIPYLNCKFLKNTFSYYDLYEVLEKLPIPYLNGWLRLIVHKRADFSIEQNNRVRPMWIEARKRLELFHYQNIASQHLLHLKDYLRQYPTLVTDKQGKPEVKTQTLKAPTVRVEEHPLTGKNELDFILAEKNIQTIPLTIQPLEKHGAILNDEYSK